MSAAAAVQTRVPFRAVATSRTTWIGLALILAYWPLAYRLPSDLQLEMEQLGRAVFGFGVSVGYARATWRALAATQPSYGAQLVLGVNLVALGGAGNSVWILLWRLSGKPPWMLAANVNGFFLWLLILGAVLHLTAKRFRDPGTEVKYADLRVMNWCLGITFVGAVVLVLARPDLSSVAAYLGTTWLNDGF